MRARPLVHAVAGLALASGAVLGLTACHNTGATAETVDLSGSPVSAKDDMASTCAQIVQQALPVEAAQAVAEASGYTTRIGTLDGTPQPVTADARDDRLTFEVTDDVVTGCTIG